MITEAVVAAKLVSPCGHVVVTQPVDKPNLGVHVKLPKSISGKK
jgi:acetamidase/formamidase